MKKKTLQLKLNLKKQTVTDLNTVTGGIVNNVKTQLNCEINTFQCPTQGTAYPCCPGCRSGYQATIAKEYCDIVLETVAKTACLQP